MKAALYPRVSTEEQSKEGYSLAAQLDKMRAFCFSQGWTIYKEYVEEGRSAKDMERPQLQSLLSDIPHFDVVLVYKLDRLSRNVSDINILLNTFEKNKVAFKSVTEPYDTTTAQGKLLINIFASLAQFEREQLAERTYMGMARKHEEGSRNGGRAPFGYYLDDQGKLAIDEVEAKWVRWMFEAFHTKGKKMITEELNKNGIRTRTGAHWNHSAVDYVVTNPVYYGALRWNYRTKQGNRTYEEVIVEGNHPAIITKEVYEEIKKTRKDRKNTGWKSRTVYPFSSVLRCARCGHSMSGGKRNRADGTVHRFYKCSGRFEYKICDMPVIAEDTIEQEFIKSLEYLPVETEAPDQQEVDTKEIKKELKRIEVRKARWKELYVDGDLTKKDYKEKMDAEIEKENELTRSLEINQETPTSEVINNIIENIKTKWQDISLENRKRILTTIFDTVQIECLKSHSGGSGERPVIEIKETTFK
ncbi:recombinase family protein [Bacillus sp. ISL-40]|uniref:recombinase family protein n=1 Tax=unclassified Bacillus (in: firmicutes) TaxID=185979 RepID=UPI001BEB09D1|nr:MULTISPECIES: recombinase family protein [unclassified Bacillus (in: firmicutes)]MBT2696388.1 recombinase family protein [Bacillus sp. ISL-40]MBT2743237.1 recombinase family protein [Bacillus sp. ISL-77]